MTPADIASTGATGFIGQHFVASLAQSGVPPTLRILSRRLDEAQKLFGSVALMR